MSRYRSVGATHFYCEKLGSDWYCLHWTVDRYYEGSRLRHPVGYTRDTDLVGARRFCKKHDLHFEE